jgi:hypothetical protein
MFDQATTKIRRSSQIMPSHKKSGSKTVFYAAASHRNSVEPVVHQDLRKPFMIYPDIRFRRAWDFLISVLVVVLSVSIPVELVITLMP